MKSSAFTLIEVLLVVGILAAIGLVSMPLYSDYQVRSDLNLSTEQSTQGLARAKILSQSGKHDSAWGFYIPNGTLYKGVSYATRDPAYDELYPMPSTITTTGLLEVSYSKKEGVPSETGSIILTALTGEQRSILITVQTSGIAMNEADLIMICHKPEGSNPHNLTVSENAWPAHQAHGDTLGVCPGQSSASSASSVASAQSSSLSSTAGGGGGGTCEDRFSVAADGTITTTSTVNVTYTAVGSEITYGAGGPEINVYVSYNKGNGNSYTNLFSGDDVDGGETQTVSNIESGSTLVTKVRGYYKKNGWLTFDQSFLNDDNTGHILSLRNGDSLPNYPAFNGQQSLKDYLEPYVDAQNKIVIGQYDVLYLVELGAIGSPMPSTADFQDAVLLLSFTQAPGACQ